MQKKLMGISHPAHKISLLLADVFSIALAFSIASSIRLGIIPNFFSLEYVTLSVIILISIFLGNGYTGKLLGSTPRLPLNTFFVVVSSAIPCTVFIYLMGPERFTDLFGRGIFPAAIIFIGIFALLNRVVLNRIFSERGGLKKILIIGNSETSDFVTEALSKKSVNLAVSQADMVTSAVNKTKYNAIVISPDYKASNQEQKLLLTARLGGTPLFSISDFFESFLFLIPVNKVDNDWFIRSEGFTMLHSTVTLRLKRAADILISLTLLIVSIPIVALCTVGIKLSSKGPAIFSQIRVGHEGSVFKIYKLRTMRIDAEENGAQWASSDDKRIFRFGGFLRKSRIDELPQCWNILRGDMSIIGPRPERPEFTSSLAKDIPYYDLRHVVKPGLTGWAQVNYPYGASTEDSLRKLQYDLYYIKNYSLLLDLNILLRTVLVTIKRSGR